MTYTTDSESNTSLIDCFVSGNQFLTCNNPSPNANGFSDIVVRVTDTETGFDTDTVRITVNPVNDAPVFDPPLVNHTINVSSELLYDINATDIEGDTLTFYDNVTQFDINPSNGLINKPVN